MCGLYDYILMSLGLMALGLLAALACHILKAKALSHMAQNAGLDTSLAWFPFANNYLLGALCEQSETRRTGKTWKFSVLLPVLDLAAFFSASARPWGSLLNIGRAIRNPSFCVAIVLAITFWVMMLAALYKVFRDYSPVDAVFYTILSAIFGILAQSILLFSLRDRTPVSAQTEGHPPQGPDPSRPQDDPPGNGSGLEL